MRLDTDYPGRTFDNKLIDSDYFATIQCPNLPSSKIFQYP